MSLRLFIFSEDGFFNSTLTASLSLIGFDLIGESDNETVALNSITHHCPDVVILGVDHGRIKAIELGATLRKRFPEMGLVLISKTEDLRLLGINLKKLPIGLVLSQVNSHGAIDLLKEKIILATASTKTKPTIKIDSRLTDSQVETIRLLAAGNANSEIAKMRFVSEKSVEQMLARIAQMLDISFDYQHNSRVRILNSYYELVNGRK